MGSEEDLTGDPYLSVVVPVHKVEPYLAKCLGSILADTTVDVEVVAVDDASPDRCPLILDDFARRDPRVRVVRLPANVGLGQARNAGLDHATGEYVWFVDGDDWLPTGAVRSVIDRLKVTKPDVLVIDHAEVFDESRPLRGESDDLLRGLTAPIRLADRPHLLRLAQSACTKVARRAFLADTGLRFRPGWYEDTSFSHPLLMAASRIDALNTVCYCYRQRPQGGITRTLSSRHFEVFDQYAWLFDLLDNSAGAYEEFRPELFRLMINHYLVIVGNDQRLPPNQQRPFFRQISEDYRRRRPADGYPMPSGLTGLRHRLVGWDAYWTYAVLRRCYRAAGQMRRMLGLGRHRETPLVGTGTLVPARTRAVTPDRGGVPHVQPGAVTPAQAGVVPHVQPGAVTPAQAGVVPRVLPAGAAELQLGAITDAELSLAGSELGLTGSAAAEGTPAYPIDGVAATTPVSDEVATGRSGVTDAVPPKAGTGDLPLEAAHS